MQIVCFWFESSPVHFGICAIAVGRRPLIVLLWLLVAAVTFVIWIAVLIWAIFIVIVCHRTWCLWTCMWYRCTIFVHLRMIRMLWMWMWMWIRRKNALAVECLHRDFAIRWPAMCRAFVSSRFLRVSGHCRRAVDVDRDVYVRSSEHPW